MTICSLFKVMVILHQYMILFIIYQLVFMPDLGVLLATIVLACHTDLLDLHVISIALSVVKHQ